MNGYVCFYEDKRLEIYADTSYAAQQDAQQKIQRMFPRRKVKGYQISVHLCEKDGEQVINKPMM